MIPARETQGLKCRIFWCRIESRYVFNRENTKRKNIDPVKLNVEQGMNVVDSFQHYAEYGKCNPKYDEIINNDM